MIWVILAGIVMAALVLIGMIALLDAMFPPGM